MEMREPSAKYLAGAAFKQTELGHLPIDWDVQQIGDFQPFVTSGSRGWAIFYSAYGSLFVRITNLTRERIYLDLSDVRFVNLTTASSEGQRTQLKAGDVLISITADIGIVGYVTETIPQPAYINQHIALVRFDPAKVHSRYVTYFLASERVQKLFRSLTDSGAKAGMNLATVRQIKFAVPDTLAEQQAIATALSDADALIESLEQLLAKKRQIKQCAMQELLTGKRRLPGFGGEWKKVSLLELANGRKELFDDGDWIEAEHITSEGVRLIQTGNIGIGQFLDKAEKKYIFESSFAALNCKVLRTGDLLICRLADPAGRACILPDLGEEKVITSVDVTIFRPPETLANREFLANVFSTPDWFREVSDRSGGTTHKRIARGALGRIKIRIPDVIEQIAIATMLSDLDADITALEAKLTKARSIKQGMMQELLTGRIRLVSPQSEGAQ